MRSPGWLMFRASRPPGWRTVWMAVWFHALHNAVSQVLVPKALGAGDARILSEAGVLPVALYLATAGAVFGPSTRLHLRSGQAWRGRVGYDGATWRDAR
jgi:hypothetical protein